MPKLMNKVERDFISKKIAIFYNSNGCNSSMTYKHFMEENVCKRTITRALARLKETGTAVTKSPTGSPMKKTNVKALSKMKTMLKRNPCISLKKGSAKMNIPKTTYSRMVKKNLCLKKYKQTECSKLSTRPK